jgi:cytoskeleton protein RodZ
MAPEQRIPGGVGSKLREARERRGISIRQIADTTKISTAFLEALERNDIKRLPGGIFSRSFVRTYAVEVGLPPEEIIQEFVAQFPNDPVSAGRPAAEQHDDNENVESDRRLAAAVLKLVAISLPIAAIVLYFGLSGRRAAPKPPAPAAYGADPGGMSATSGTSAAGGPADARPDDHFVVGVGATARSFVTAAVDGQHAIERELQPGEHVEFTVRREIVLTAADAGAVGLTLDGALAKPLGKAGDAATVRLNTENFKDYLVKR